VLNQQPANRVLTLSVAVSARQDGVEAVQSSQSAAAAEAKKPSKGQPANGADAALDADWVGAHASQVAKMLPGGVLNLILLPHRWPDPRPVVRLAARAPHAGTNLPSAVYVVQGLQCWGSTS